jgi:hypothetical protein
MNRTMVVVASPLEVRMRPLSSDAAGGLTEDSPLPGMIGSSRKPPRENMRNADEAGRLLATRQERQ